MDYSIRRPLKKKKIIIKLINYKGCLFSVCNTSEVSNGPSTGSSSVSALKNEATAESESNNYNAKLTDRHARLIGKHFKLLKTRTKISFASSLLY